MYIYTVKFDNKIQKVVSLLAPQEIADKELPAQGILGILREGGNQGKQIKINCENFISNPQFVNFIHNIIVRFAPSIPNLINEAKRQNKGWIYLIDARCPEPAGNVLPEDIIGAFELQEGQIIIESYQRNNNYLIFSQNGFFKLEPRLEKHLIEETRKLIGK
jgi:hypothetical protein